jgi:hypothetical protein
MSKPRTPVEQFYKTHELLIEIRSLSQLKWTDMYSKLIPAKLGFISGETHLRQLGTGHRFLSDANLSKLATWALSNEWGGDLARAAAAYIEPSRKEIDDLEMAKRHEQYLLADPMERVINNPMREAELAKRRSAAMLDGALSALSPAGYSHADIQYMVHSWLTKNPPTSDRGKRQRKIVLFDDPDTRGFDATIYPESLPTNFSLPEHRDGLFPCFIKCRFSTHVSTHSGSSPDNMDDTVIPESKGNPATRRRRG